MTRQAYSLLAAKYRSTAFLTQSGRGPTPFETHQDMLRVLDVMETMYADLEQLVARVALQDAKLHGATSLITILVKQLGGTAELSDATVMAASRDRLQIDDASVDGQHVKRFTVIEDAMSDMSRSGTGAEAALPTVPGDGDRGAGE